MALATIPMPKENIYKFDGPMVGTFSTCKAQAYLICWGAATGAFLNLFLSWCCVFDTTFKIKPETVQRMEPFFYFCAAICGIFVPTLFLCYDLLNAQPFDPFCSIGPHPFGCKELKGTKYEGTSLECDESDNVNYRSTLNVLSVILFIQFCGITLAMIIIIWTALRNEMQINAEKKDAKENELHIELEQDEVIMISTARQSENRTSIKKPQYNRVMVFQALMYIAAFFLTWVFVFVPHFDKDQGNDTTIFALQCVFRNLQGFWNMIIFIHLKTYMVLKHKDGATVWAALKTVILEPRNVPEVYISNIDLVVDENDKKRENEFVSSEIISNASPPNSRLSIGSGFDSRDSASYSRLTLGSQNFPGCNGDSMTSVPFDSKPCATMNEDWLPDSEIRGNSLKVPVQT